MPTPIDLSGAKRLTCPFDSFHTIAAIGEADAAQILTWLECCAPWELSVQDFYEQYEFSLFDVTLPTEIAFLTSPGTLQQLRYDVGMLLEATLNDRVDVTAHKLITGQRIRIHNDFVPGQETHRLLIQLNCDWCESNGGLLMLFSGPEPNTVSRIIFPESRSAFGFRISTRSFHAVTPVNAGDRFTLVYSFYEKC